MTVRKLKPKKKLKPKPVLKGAKGVQQEPPTDTPYRAQQKEKRLRVYKVGEGMPVLTSTMAELQDMTDVLLGRVEPPYWHGPITLMELADTFFARAAELTMLIHEGERLGTVPKGSSWQKFRTGELRTFMEMCKRAADLGSRYLTDEQLRFEQEKTGRESLGFRS